MWSFVNSSFLNFAVLLHGSKKVAGRCLHLLEEWWNLQDPKPSALARRMESWERPVTGWVKAHADGALAKHSSKGGGGNGGAGPQAAQVMAWGQRNFPTYISRKKTFGLGHNPPLTSSWASDLSPILRPIFPPSPGPGSCQAFGMSLGGPR